MNESATRATVEDVYDAYGRRDMERVAALLHDDIDWVIYGPIEVFPFVGMRRGRKAVLEAIVTLFELFSLESHQREIMIVEGDRAAIMSDVGFKQRATGRTLRFRVANFMRFQDGRLIEFREFADSFDLVEQAIGHAVEL